MEFEFLTTSTLRFGIHRAGNGPRTALLLHGFPDDPHSLHRLMERLAAQDFTAIAPFMRGYGPTERPADGDYQIAALAEDLIAILDALQARQAVLIGHDWGAITAYAAANLAPDRFSHLITMSVPPLPIFLRNMTRHPSQLLRSWYILFFQLPWLPEWELERHDFAFLERLGGAWSRGCAMPPWHIRQVKQTFAYPGTTKAALSYYRGLLRDAPVFRRAWTRSHALSYAPIRVPTLMMCGARDGCITPEMFENAGPAFAADYRLKVIDGAGHFLQLDAPEEVAGEVLRFVQDGGSSTNANGG